MPGGDKTGPAGRGPMTGRAAGYCTGYGAPGYANPAPGRNFGAGFRRGCGAWGRGFGGGRGWRNQFYATGQPGWMRFRGYAAPYEYGVAYSNAGPETEKKTLRSQAEVLQSELDFIKKRLAEIETETPAE